MTACEFSNGTPARRWQLTEIVDVFSMQTYIGELPCCLCLLSFCVCVLNIEVCWREAGNDLCYQPVLELASGTRIGLTAYQRSNQQRLVDTVKGFLFSATTTTATTVRPQNLK